MAIKIIFGPGGSGKSFFQMHVIIKHLRETRQNICTNLAINVPEFNEYLERRYPNEDLNLVGRLRILSETETYEFWNYRGPLKWTGNEYEMEEDKGVFGVCYVIDEAGVSGFSATGWAQKMGQSTRGEKCLWYLDQQRKFGDDVFASTNGRTPAQIAKPFRDKGHGFIRLKNGYLASYGPFRGRGRFEWKEFLEEPNRTSEAIAKGIFEMGELASCYRTQDGVGVIGSQADKGRRAKGIPIMWVIPGALVLALSCVFVPYLLGKGVSSYVGGAKTKETKQTSALVTSAANSIGAVIKPPAPPAAAPIPAMPVDHERPLTMTGYVCAGKRINVQLSDGRVLTELDPNLAHYDKNSITLRTGERLYLVPRSFSPPAPPPVTVTTPPPAEPVAPSNIMPPPPSQPPSSWQLHSDGVSRLVNSSTGPAR